jgi:hypothetical protein
MPTGKLNADRGYGFIADDSGGPEQFRDFCCSCSLVFYRDLAALI